MACDNVNKNNTNERAANEKPSCQNEGDSQKSQFSLQSSIYSSNLKVSSRQLHHALLAGCATRSSTARTTVRVVSTRGEATIDQPVSDQQAPDGMFLAAVQPPCTVRLVVRRNIQCSGITLENGGRREGAHRRGDLVTKSTR
jgi:hypothetical protein